MNLKLECDKLCSQIVRLRDKGQCRLCQNPGIEVHHIARKGGNVRYFLDNLLWICRACHDHDNEPEMNIRIINTIGGQKFENLQIMAHQIKQWKKQDLVELRESLKEILLYYTNNA